MLLYFVISVEVLGLSSWCGGATSSRDDTQTEGSRAKYNISATEDQPAEQMRPRPQFCHRFILYVYQYARFGNGTDTPRGFPLMDSLDCVQPGSSLPTAGLFVSRVHIRPPTS